MYTSIEAILTMANSSSCTENSLTQALADLESMYEYGNITENTYKSVKALLLSKLQRITS